jgi:hypothetical protein
MRPRSELGDEEMEKYFQTNDTPPFASLHIYIIFECKQPAIQPNFISKIAFFAPLCYPKAPLRDQYVLNKTFVS